MCVTERECVRVCFRVFFNFCKHCVGDREVCVCVSECGRERECSVCIIVGVKYRCKIMASQNLIIMALNVRASIRTSSLYDGILI